MLDSKEFGFKSVLALVLYMCYWCWKKMRNGEVLCLWNHQQQYNKIQAPNSRFDDMLDELYESTMFLKLF